MAVAGIVITVWIYNASPKNLNKFIKFLEQKPVDYRLTRRGKKKKKNVHEEKCREIFERLFGANFPSTRKIKWLRNPETNRPLELDGYNPHIKTPKGKGLAFEYDGAQHAAPSAHFHGSDSVSEFSSQFRRDQHKTRLCKEHGVMLIRIHHLVDFDKLEDFIVKKLQREGFDLRGSGGA